jgi:hypothetical protein
VLRQADGACKDDDLVRQGARHDVALRQVLEGNENSVAGNIFKRSKNVKGGGSIHRLLFFKFVVGYSLAMPGPPKKQGS